MTATTVNYKGVQITVNSITGMATAEVKVNQVAIVLENNKPVVTKLPKDEKLFGRPNYVKRWIDKYIDTLVL